MRRYRALWCGDMGLFCAKIQGFFPHPKKIGSTILLAIGLSFVFFRRYFWTSPIKSCLHMSVMLRGHGHPQKIFSHIHTQQKKVKGKGKKHSAEGKVVGTWAACCEEEGVCPRSMNPMCEQLFFSLTLFFPLTLTFFCCALCVFVGRFFGLDYLPCSMLLMHHFGMVLFHWTLVNLFFCTLENVFWMDFFVHKKGCFDYAQGSLAHT